MDVNLGKAQPLFISRCFYRGDIIQVYAEAGVFTTGVAGGAFSTASSTGMNTHGEIYLVGLGKVGN